MNSAADNASASAWPAPCRSTQRHRVRRARFGAGRVDSGPDYQPAGRLAGTIQPDLPLHRPRPVGGAPHQRPGGSNVPGQVGGRLRTATPFTKTHSTRTRGHCCQRCRSPTRCWTLNENASSWTGEVPSPLNPPSGCVFHPRCPMVTEDCSRVLPETRESCPTTLRPASTFRATAHTDRYQQRANTEIGGGTLSPPICFDKHALRFYPDCTRRRGDIMWDRIFLLSMVCTLSVC